LASLARLNCLRAEQDAVKVWRATNALFCQALQAATAHHCSLLTREQLPNRLRSVPCEVVVHERQDGHTLAQEPDRLGIGLDLIATVDHSVI
jgi:hypothetical protein